MQKEMLDGEVLRRGCVTRGVCLWRKEETVGGEGGRRDGGAGRESAVARRAHRGGDRSAVHA